jgi:hypothetical protein
MPWCVPAKIVVKEFERKTKPLACLFRAFRRKLARSGRATGGKALLRLIALMIAFAAAPDDLDAIVTYL